MDKIEALENINMVWHDADISLKQKVEQISNYYYSSGLELNSTASFIKATPSELEALLSLSELEEDVLEKISEVDPPKTTWTFFANGNQEEVEEALKKMGTASDKKVLLSEVVYKSMLDISGPPSEQKINMLTASEIKYIREKAEQYKKLTDKEVKFLKSLAARKGKGQSLTEKQIQWFLSILNDLADASVISRDSKDDDQELCNKVLDYIGR